MSFSGTNILLAVLFGLYVQVPASAHIATEQIATEQAATEQTAEEAGAERFAPVAELAGWCFVAQLPGNGGRDIHCWEWVLHNQFLRNRHDLSGPNGVYSGETLYRWDEQAGVLRYWYFTSLGGVSEGEVRKRDGEWFFLETYRGDGGPPIELRTQFRRDDDRSYSVVTEQKEGDEWRPQGALRLERIGTRKLALGGDWTEQWDLVFNAERDGNYDVFRLDSRTGAQTNLTRSPATEFVYDGGERLLFVSNRPTGVDPGYRLYELDLTQESAEWFQLTDFPVADSWVGVAPERRSYVVCSVVDGDRELVQIDRWGRIEAQLTDNEADDCQPDVSSDGKTIVFWSDRGGSAEIWRMNIGGSEPRQLTDFKNNDRSPSHRYGGEGPPRISPDGSKIAWMSLRDRETFDIYVMNLDGSEVRRLTDHLADDGYPSWSPDGRYIAFDSERFGSTDIFVMNADGSGIQRITDDESPELAPVFVPRKPR